MTVTAVPITERNKGETLRDERGRFLKGTRGGNGNPHWNKVHEWRRTFAEAVTSEDIQEVVAKLVAKAKSGDVFAIREFLNRTTGPAEAVIATNGGITVQYVIAAAPAHIGDQRTPNPQPTINSQVLTESGQQNSQQKAAESGSNVEQIQHLNSGASEGDSD